MAPNKTETSPLLPSGAESSLCEPSEGTAAAKVALEHDEGEDGSPSSSSIVESPKSWLRLLLYFAAATWSSSRGCPA